MCLFFGPKFGHVKSALRRECSNSNIDDATSKPNLSLDPFGILEIFVSQINRYMETDRLNLDVKVRNLESKTGMSGHYFPEQLRATNADLEVVRKEMHTCEGLLAFFAKICEFEMRWTEWLRKQHNEMSLIRFGTYDVREMEPKYRPTISQVIASLDLGASLARERYEQVKTLCNRIQIQLDVVSHGK